MRWTRANQLAIDNQAPADEEPCWVCGDDGDECGIDFEGHYICVDCVLGGKADDYVYEADKQKVRDDLTMNGGEGKVTDRGAELLYNIANDRMTNNLPTWYTSNIKPAGIADWLPPTSKLEAKRIIRRISESVEMITERG